MTQMHTTDAATTGAQERTQAQVWGELRSFFQAKGRRINLRYANSRELWQILDIADRDYLKEALIPYVLEHLSECCWDVPYPEELSALDPDDPRGLLVRKLIPLGACNPHYLEELAARKYLCNVETLILTNYLQEPIPDPGTDAWYARANLEHYTMQASRALAVPILLPEVSLTPLAQNPNLSKLRSINLDMCNIGDEGLQELALSPYLKNLSFLSLRDSQVTLNGLLSFAMTAQMPALRHLSVERKVGGYVPAFYVSLEDIKSMGLSALETLHY